MKYIAFYDFPELRNENRYVNAAARGVIEYMIEVFSSVEKVEVISPGRTLNQKGIYKSKKIEISKNVTLKAPFTFATKTKPGRVLSLCWLQIWLFFYLLFHTKKGEKVVFYHSLSLMTIISLLSKVKKINPILEFREIYSDINKVSKRLTKKEHKYYSCAYAFIFPSEAIKNRLDICSKPYVLAPGSYLTHKYEDNSFNDGKIHLVYAGNLRKDKGGAFLAVEAAKFLPERHIVHILSGDYLEEELTSLNKEINKAAEFSSTEIVFEGSKFGEDFYKFLSKCDIGLATQKDGEFSNTSFPSKILTYLGCGLKVIAPPIEAVSLSPISHYVYEFCEYHGKSIAKAIIESEKNNNSIVDLQLLDKKLKKDLKEIIY